MPTYSLFIDSWIGVGHQPHHKRIGSEVEFRSINRETEGANEVQGKGNLGIDVEVKSLIGISLAKFRHIPKVAMHSAERRIVSYHTCMYLHVPAKTVRGSPVFPHKTNQERQKGYC